MDAQSKFLMEFKEALQAFLGGAGEDALSRAYEISRRAVADRVGVLEMVEVQHRVLAELLEKSGAPGETRRVVEKAANFFVETLSPLEMTHRAYRDANIVLRRLNDILEEEAKRIAHAIHDDSGQILAAAQIALDREIRDLHPNARKGLVGIRDLLQTLGERLRSLSHELRPTILDDLGLFPAIEFLASGIARRSGLRIAVGGPLRERLPPQIEVVLYRVVQEALTNVMKHSRATSVAIHLAREADEVRCSIKDNGSGFDIEEVLGRKGRGGLGIVGIRERIDSLGGTLKIDSAPELGTELSICAPIKEDPHGSSDHSRR